MRARLIDWWRRRRLTAPRLDELVWFESQTELPQELPRQVVAIVGTRERPKWLVAECPCGTGHRLQLNLTSRYTPRWHLKEHHGKPNLYPSVDAEAPSRRCHFWLRRGRVRWTPDSFVGPDGPSRRGWWKDPR